VKYLILSSLLSIGLMLLEFNTVLFFVKRRLENHPPSINITINKKSRTLVVVDIDTKSPS
jgi:hypothetical protein